MRQQQCDIFSLNVLDPQLVEGQLYLVFKLKMPGNNPELARLSDGGMWAGSLLKASSHFSRFSTRLHHSLLASDWRAAGAT